jgi:hypothetical protein
MRGPHEYKPIFALFLQGQSTEGIKSAFVYGHSIGVHHTPYRYFMGIASVDILITVQQLGICKHFLLLKKRYFFSVILLFNFFPGRIIEDLQYFLHCPHVRYTKLFFFFIFQSSARTYVNFILPVNKRT